MAPKIVTCEVCGRLLGKQGARAHYAAHERRGEHAPPRIARTEDTPIGMVELVLRDTR